MGRRPGRSSTSPTTTPKLAAKVAAGRLDFLAQFPSLTSEAIRAQVPAPGAAETFASCKLDWAERERHAPTVALHRDLLRAAARGAGVRGGPAGAGARARCWPTRRWRCGSSRRKAGDDRLLIVNLGRDLGFASVPEPLLAPPAGQRWRTSWSSEEPRYGGGGTAPVETDEGLRLPGHAAIVLAPEREQGEAAA